MSAHHRRHARSSFALLVLASSLLIGSVGFLSLKFGGAAIATAARAGGILRSSCSCAGAGVSSGYMTALTTALLVVGAAALLFLAVRFAMLVARTRRFVSSVAVVPMSAKLKEVAEAVGVAQDVREFDNGLATVFCAGLLRPKIYVPSSVVGLLDAGELRAVLEHERFHIRHRDPLRLILADLVRVFPGFAPVVDDYRATVELAADEEVIDRMADGASLGRALLRLLSAQGFLQQSRVAAVAFFNSANRRIDHLLGVGAPAPKGRRILCIVGSVIVAATALYAGLRLTPPAAARATALTNGQCIMPPSCRTPAAPKSVVPTYTSSSTVTLLSATAR